MLPTHALGGMALALPLVAIAPDLASVALVAGLLGGIVPDLDLYVGHRKTLHFPVYYSALAATTTLVAVLVPTAATVAIATLLLGAALHSVSDVFGSGLELRPWEATSDRAVYDHYNEIWIEPRRVIRYDGSPTDLLLSITLSIPLSYALEGSLQWIVIAAITVAVGYSAFRRPLADFATVVVDLLPMFVLPYVPERYLEAVGRNVRREPQAEGCNHTG